MNERNKWALNDVLGAIINGHPDWAQRGSPWLAEQLASWGVLAPSSLTEEQCAGLPFGDAYPGQPSEEVPAFVRATLELIAKGEDE